MTLEATLLCIDNSEWSRNADYLPTRFEAQQDCVNLICNSKIESNPENSVGILTMAHERIDVRVAPTDDLGKILQGLHGVQLDGTSDFIRGIQTAQLALKHRMNKNQRQRIVVFVCSPVCASERQLEQVGRMLKKNSVSLDIVSFGKIEENASKLQKLFQAVNSSDTSHILEVPKGLGLLSDKVMSSAIIRGEAAVTLPDGSSAPGAAVGGEDGPEFLGVNPSTDPELYMALRMSLDEERARIQRAAAEVADTTAAEETAPDADGNVSTATAAAAPAAPSDTAAASQSEPPAASAESSDGAAAAPPHSIPTVQEIQNMEDVDEELRQALLLSVQDYAGPELSSAPEPSSAAEESTSAAETSTQVQPPADAKPDSSSPAEAAAPATEAAGFQDPNFVRSLIGDLPGVDITDPRIQEALRGVGGASSKPEESKTKEDEHDKEGNS